MPETAQKTDFDYLEKTKRNHFWVGGPRGQEKIRTLRVGVAGLGGMGSNIAEIFARVGVGAMKITDPDLIDKSNFNRQVIANEETVGQKKAFASEAELRRIRPDLNLSVSAEGITERNADKFVEGCDVIINEIDVSRIDMYLVLLNAARRAGIPAYTTLVVGLGIHLYKFDPKSSYTPEEFLGPMLRSKDVETLINRLGEPLPVYLSGGVRREFADDVAARGVPIFGASTYLGQSLLVIRVLHDLGFLRTSSHLAATPALPEFLILDPITFEFKVTKVMSF